MDDLNHQDSNRRSVEFVETDRFTRKREALISDDDLRRIQLELIGNPAAGVILRGTGGFRKIRMATRGRGKSGSARLIYFFITKKNQILLYDVFEKSGKASLTNQERNELKRVAGYLK